MIHSRFCFPSVVKGFGSELNLRRASLLKPASSLVLILSIIPMALAQGTGADWPSYGGTQSAWRYSA